MTTAGSSKGTDLLMQRRWRMLSGNHMPCQSYDGCVRGAFQILVNPTSGGSRLLGGILTNMYLSVSSVTVPLWRRGFPSWHVEDVYPQNITVRLKFSVHDICKLWSHCSHLQARPTWLSWILCPLLPWDDDDSHWLRHQHLYWMT